MIKLGQLKNYLLESQLNIPREHITVFADEGTAINHRGLGNGLFETIYKANIIITDYPGPAKPIIYFMLSWLESNQVNLPENALAYRVDVLDDNLVDLHFTTELSECCNVIETDTSWQFDEIEDPVINDFDDVTSIQ